jgi:thiol-disulfide isomerase/thioredoxin
VKTVASLGDKPLPIVSGEPGASLRAETEEPDLPPARGSRISGRVYDDRGHPVPNARVRLAVGGTPGGHVVRATTDRSGAFTLRGLQSGASYTLIAEYPGETGTLTGRVQAKASETDVRIRLVSSDGDSEAGHASIRPARPRVEPISNVDAADDVETDRGANSLINNEDMDAPAPEAAALAPRRNLPVSRAAADSASAPLRAGWNVRQSGSKKDPKPSTEPPRQDDDASSTARSSRSGQAADDPDDDGPNPLPSAIERGAVRSERVSRLQDADPIRVARSQAPDSSRPRPAEADDTAPRTIPADLLGGERVITPGSYAPIVVTDPREAKTSRAGAPVRVRRAESSVEALEKNPPLDVDRSHALDSSDARDPADGRRQTWREFSLKQADIPVDESISRATANVPAAERNVVTLASTSRPAGSRLSRFFPGPQPPPAESATPSECQIDTSERRIVNFKLPDPSGKLVSLQDFDADVILLDFWGSWCAPCRKSIPHLIERRRDLAGKRFQVIGIACEKGATLADRQASAAKAVQDLNIDYPVLISSMGGACPVQKALQVQFYPTMILLDREGRLLAREQGATDSTLPRMDRAIAAALRDESARR